MKLVIIVATALVLAAPAQSQSWQLDRPTIETRKDAEQRRNAERYLYQREMRSRYGISPRTPQLRGGTANTLSNGGFYSPRRSRDRSYR